jgi:hypothetical protein
LIHSTCTWLLPPVHDWLNLNSIHSSSNSLIQPVFDHFILYSICLTCRGCIPSIQHVFGWCDRYLSHKSRNWAAFAICQVYRYHSMTVTISSHAFNSFDLYLIESYSISWILPLLDWFDLRLCLICATVARHQLLDYFHHIWTIQTVFDGFNSIVGSKQHVIYSTCTWFALCLIHRILFGLFKQYHVLLPIMNHSSRLWSIQSVLDCFHLYMID